MKRSPEEVKLAKDLILIWLNKYNNNPNLAFSEFIRCHMEIDMEFPYYVIGLEEFIKISKPA